MSAAGAGDDTVTPQAPSVMPPVPVPEDPIVALAADGIAISRIALGIAALLAPGLVGRAFGIGDAPGTRTAARYLGGRDLAIGLGMLLGRRRGQARGWFEAAALVDAIDTAASVRAISAGVMTRAHGTLVVALTSSSALTSAAIARVVDEPMSTER
jgi:hypothetical protein